MVTDPLGAEHTFEHTESGLLAGVSDDEGQSTRTPGRGWVPVFVVVMVAFVLLLRWRPAQSFEGLLSFYLRFIGVLLILNLTTALINHLSRKRHSPAG